jgi:hypothetical protein
MNCFNTLIGPLRWGAASPRGKIIALPPIATNHSGHRQNHGLMAAFVAMLAVTLWLCAPPFAVIILRIIAQFSAAARGYVRSTAIRWAPPGRVNVHDANALNA